MSMAFRIVTIPLLAAGILGWEPGVPLACLLGGLHIVASLQRTPSLHAPLVQLRIAWVALLLLGQWQPLGFLHVLQLLAAVLIVLVSEGEDVVERRLARA